ncbi:hypothetical protein BLA29_010422 [Euroglyphus maynei]|uniref:Uncharacterized protein n=1 Tax=Euroglyphus maynei TaxID=6958 RepID=A0A1Y3BXH6_EURMA|nr:hypothetical protein BLA29_010422 [Euroglyphus maynei]
MVNPYDHIASTLGLNLRNGTTNHPGYNNHGGGNGYGPCSSPIANYPATQRSNNSPSTSFIFPYTQSTSVTSHMRKI